MKKRDAPPVQSLDRGLTLLATVAEAGRSLGLSELTEVLGIDRSSVFRLAKTLRLKGFLVQSPHDKSYTLGSAILQLAGSLQSTGSLVHMAHPQVVHLAAETHETAHLGVRQETRAVLLDHVPSDQPVSVASRCGQTAPLHCTAMGKALLGDFDLSRLQVLYGSDRLSAETPRTVRSLERLAAECERTRKRGYAVDDGEFDKGVRCIAAGVRDGAGQVVAGIGISAPASRLPKQRLAEIAQNVIQAAREISVALGHAAAGNGQVTHIAHKKEMSR